jgi:ABC-2 type transport system permease protein
MLDSLRLYIRYVGISIRSQMEYRASFVMTSIGQLVATLIEFVGILVLFQRFGSLRGWTLPQVALFYGIANIAFAIAEGVGRGFDLFPNMVKTGDFDRLLLRPRGTALQVAASECHLRFGRLLQGIAVLAWAMAMLPITWSPERIAVLVAAIAGGVCVFYGLFVLQATMSFWTIDGLEVMNTVTYGGNETAQYPLTIYRPWFRRFFTFVVPLACMNFIPASALLGTVGVPIALAWASPLIGVAFLAASLHLWRVGVRHYHSTGS